MTRGCKHLLWEYRLTFQAEPNILPFDAGDSCHMDILRWQWIDSLQFHGLFEAVVILVLAGEQSKGLFLYSYITNICLRIQRKNIFQGSKIEKGRKYDSLFTLNLLKIEFCRPSSIVWNKYWNSIQGELQQAALLLKANEACFVTPQTATANYLIKGYHCNDPSCCWRHILCIKLAKLACCTQQQLRSWDKGGTDSCCLKES